MKRFIRKWLGVCARGEIENLADEVKDLRDDLGNLGTEHKQLVYILGYERQRIVTTDSLWGSESITTKLVKRGKK